MVGLAATTARRGCRLVRIPTTTLSQDDSGVGVKNGINAFGKKNFIGTFAPPFAVINDFNLLASLSPRDKRAGYIEAVKVALIRDGAFFETLERTPRDCAFLSRRPWKNSSSGPRNCTWTISRDLATRLSSARRGLWILVIGRRTSSSRYR